MRHRHAGRHLGRTDSHRVALFRNLARALITHESIRTTVPKAKELRPFVEKLITLAKKSAVLTAQAEAATDEGQRKQLKVQAVHYRRLAMSKLGPTHGTGIYDKKDEAVTDRTQNTVLKKLFNVIGPRYKERPGGYTRILKLHYRRLGDAGETAQIELLKEGEQKVKMKQKAAPAPVAPTAG